MSETITKPSKTREQTQQQLERIVGRIERRAKKAGNASLEAAGVKLGDKEILTKNDSGGFNSVEKDPYGVGDKEQLNLFHYDRDAGRSTQIISDTKTGELAYGHIDASDPKRSVHFFDNPNPNVPEVRQATADLLREMRAAIPVAKK